MLHDDGSVWVVGEVLPRVVPSLKDLSVNKTFVDSFFAHQVECPSDWLM